MYNILEHRQVVKELARTPVQIKKNYLAWTRIIEFEGPEGLKLIKGFHDEALKGEWLGYRSSRLNKQWRVIYKIDREILVVYVVEITRITIE